MTRQERRSEKKKYERDFAAFCRIMKQYFPHFTEWQGELNYLLTQTADILLQLYEKGSPGFREAKRDIKKISSDLPMSFGERLTGENILFITAHGYVKAVP